MVHPTYSSKDSPRSLTHSDSSDAIFENARSSMLLMRLLCRVRVVSVARSLSDVFVIAVMEFE